MDVKFADSFGDSLKTLIMHNTWWYKTYEVVRYKIPVKYYGTIDGGIIVIL
jgi:hypothetical protein